jgi:hypothetical protein
MEFQHELDFELARIGWLMNYNREELDAPAP